VREPKIIDKEYGIIHFDLPIKEESMWPLYQKKKFQPTSFSNILVYFIKKGNIITEEVTEKTRILQMINPK
jgi:hypothetical protein